MKAAVRCGALVALLLLGTACADSVSPTAPTTTATTPPPPIASPPTPPPASDFPAVTRPARIYGFAGQLSYPVHRWTMSSRYVLYDDGAFTLQYLLSVGPVEYLGRYTEANGLITFHLEGSNAGPWTATLDGDSLSVQYNIIMEHSDFENAVYLRTQ